MKHRPVKIDADDGINELHLWEKISSAMDKKEKRRRLFLILFFLGALLGAYLITSLHMLDKTSPQPMKNALLHEHGAKAEINNDIVDKQAITLKEGGQEVEGHQGREVEPAKSAIFSRPKSSKNVSLPSNDILVIQEAILHEVNTKEASSVDGFTDTHRATNNLKNNNDWLEVVAPFTLPVNTISSIDPALVTMLLDISTNKTHDEKKEVNKFQISYYNGFGYLSTQNDFDDKQEWQTLKNNSEKGFYTAQAALMVHRTLPAGVKIGSGLEWENTVFHFKGQQVTTTSSEVKSDSARYINIEGQFYYLEGTRILTKTKTDHYDVFNTYNALKMPIEIGYILHSGKGQLDCTVGTAIILLNKMRGFTYNDQLAIVPYKQLGDAFKLNKGICDINFQLNYQYPLNKHFDLRLGIRDDISIKNYYTINYNNQKTYGAKNNRAYLTIGLTYNLGLPKIQ